MRLQALLCGGYQGLGFRVNAVMLFFDGEALGFSYNSDTLCWIGLEEIHR